MRLNLEDRASVFLLGIFVGFLAMGLVWHFGVRPLVPAPERFSFPNLIQSFWHSYSQQNFTSYSGHIGRVFLTEGYSYYILSVVPVAIAGPAGGVWLIERETPLFKVFKGGALGFVGGAVIGLGVMLLVPLLLPGLVNPLLIALAMPGMAWLLGIIGLWVSGRDTSTLPVLRGAQIRETPVDMAKMVKKAIKKKRTALVGVLIDPKAEARHLAAIGVTGSGKSAALRALMHTALSRGDRHIVADPDGSAMEVFYRSGDVILNPYDARSACWDLLAEIREETDYRLLAESVFPHTNGSDDNVWVNYARDIFTACLRTWHKNKLGSSAEFIEALATADSDKLALLCEDSGAHRYFAKGNERMLGSILGTMTPALESVRQLSRVKGAPFSVRHWMREGAGSLSLWFPYQTQQIPALRALISCWMGLAISETLSFTDSDTRRVWFHIDELDALGPIQNLKNAQTRIRKKGGCMVMGFQSISQVRAVYGEAGAHTIVENCDNKLILRCGASENGGTAKFASDLIGEREVKRPETTKSHTSGRQGSMSTSTTDRHQIETAVLPAEIQRLADCSGYLKISGEPDWQRINFQPIRFEKTAESYIPAHSSHPLKGELIT